MNVTTDFVRLETILDRMPALVQRQGDLRHEELRKKKPSKVEIYACNIPTCSDKCCIYCGTYCETVYARHD